MAITRQFIALNICLALLAGCSSDDDSPMTTDSLSWQPCADYPALQCAELTVPMDYDNASAGEITIGLNKRSASQSNTHGSLLFNPGGPGGSGIELLQSLVDVESIPDSILDRYDLIGFDPRGIGSSTPVSCSEFDIDEQDGYIADRAGIDALVNAASNAATQCLSKHGTYLQYLGSLNVVRDMNAIRMALNEDTLNFIGYSYGTRLAALYLQTYPEHSGYIVLDGSVKPESSVLGLVEGAIPAMQRNLENLIGQCNRLDPDCDADRLIQRLMARVDTLLLQELTEEFELLGELILLGTQEPEVGDFLVAPLVSYLEDHDTTPLLEFLQVLESQIDDEQDSDDGTTAQIAVLCADDAARPDAQLLEDNLVKFNEQSDLFAEAYIGLLGSCIAWPEAIEPLAPITTSTAPASLVIGGSSDAQTPLPWSEEMAFAIGGHYLSSDHPGHTGVFNGKSVCIDDIVTQFLLEGSKPTIEHCNADTSN